MLINVSNHPADEWPEAQKEAAANAYGEIVDVPFPRVKPSGTTEDIVHLAEEIADDVQKLLAGRGEEEGPCRDAVLCQGEFTLAFTVTRLLQKAGIAVIGAVSERRVEAFEEDGAIRKEQIYIFEGFREYPVL